MEKIYQAIAKLIEINDSYELDTSFLKELQQKAKSAKICMPLIGKFSSGKSSLLNAVLGYSRKLLGEGLTPETAVPTELEYVEVEPELPVTVTFHSGESKKLDLAEYRSMSVDADQIKCIHFQLNCDALSRFPDIMLVDLPGFESGFDAHEQAINHYVDNSLAYLVVFPVDDMILRSSLSNALREIGAYKVPVAVVVTKAARDYHALDENWQVLQKKLEAVVGNQNLRLIVTDSEEGNIEQLLDYLCEVQEHAQEILFQRFRIEILQQADITVQYLTTLIKNTSLEGSELPGKLEQLQKDIQNINEKMAHLDSVLQADVEQCIAEIRGDVSVALGAKENTFVTMLMNGSDIGTQVTATIRETIAKSTQERLTPIMKKYDAQVQSQIRMDQIFTAESPETPQRDWSASDIVPGIMVGVGAAGATASIAVGAAVASSIAIPLAGPIIVGIVGLVMNKLNQQKRREEQRYQIRQKLSLEYFPQVIQNVMGNVSASIHKQVQQIQAEIHRKVDAERSAAEKAFRDLEDRIPQEHAERESCMNQISADLSALEELKNELQ